MVVVGCMDGVGKERDVKDGRWVRKEDSRLLTLCLRYYI